MEITNLAKERGNIKLPLFAKVVTSIQFTGKDNFFYKVQSFLVLKLLKHLSNENQSKACGIPL